MSKVLVEEQNLSDIADSIRAKNGTQDTYKPGQMSAAIDNIPSGGGADLNDYFKNETTTSQYGDPWTSWIKKIPSITIKTPYYKELFKGFQGTGIESIIFDTQPTTTMREMFRNCGKLEGKLDLSGITSSTANDLYAMFYNCQKVTEIDLSNLTIPSGTNGTEMFFNTFKLAKLDISKMLMNNLSSWTDIFTNCGRDCLQSDGAYADGKPYIYVANSYIQSYVLGVLGGTNLGWTTDNVIIKGE